MPAESTHSRKRAKRRPDQPSDATKTVLDERFVDLFINDRFKTVEKDVTTGEITESKTLLKPEDDFIIEEGVLEALNIRQSTDTQTKTKKTNKKADSARTKSKLGSKSKLEDSLQEATVSSASTLAEEEDESDDESDENERRFSSSSSSEEDEDTAMINEMTERVAERLWYGNKSKEIPTGSSTSRIAIMGCIWEEISADDIFVLCALEPSIVASLGNRAIKRVAIYKSEFGNQQLTEEKSQGPQSEYFDLLSQWKSLRSDEINDEEASVKTSLAIRDYILQRSKYYYAIVECKNIKIAEILYKEYDGLDTFFSVDGLDIRFVPDSLTEFPFKAESECTVMPSKYSLPEMGHQSVLRHSSAELKWDEDSTRTKKALRKRFTADDLRSLDLQNYLGSSSSEEDENSGKSSTSTNNRKPIDIESYRKTLLGDSCLDGSTTDNNNTLTNSNFFEMSDRDIEADDTTNKARKVVNKKKKKERQEPPPPQQESEERSNEWRTAVTLDEIKCDERFKEMFDDGGFFPSQSDVVKRKVRSLRKG